LRPALCLGTSLTCITDNTASLFFLGKLSHPIRGVRVPFVNPTRESCSCSFSSSSLAVAFGGPLPIFLSFFAYEILLDLTPPFLPRSDLRKLTEQLSHETDRSFRLFSGIASMTLRLELVIPPANLIGQDFFDLSQHSVRLLRSSVQ